MNYRQKISFEESLELPDMTEGELQKLRDIDESESYYNAAPTAAERNR